MKENSIDIVKSVATLAGAALAGPTGGFIGNLSSTILQAVIPGMPAILRTFQANILSTLVTDQTRKLIPKLTEKDRRMVNHDLQTAFRDAFIEAVQDIGGEECFPAAWKQDPKVIPPAAIYPKSTGKRLWQSRSSLASQVEECLQALVQAVKDGKVLPLDPPEKMQAGDVRSFLESDTPEKLTGTFFEQVLAPFLSGYQSLLVELPDLLHHLKLHLLDRTLVYLGENLKKRTPAWRAYNRLVLEEMRSQLTELGQGQKDLLSRMDNLLDRLQDQSSGGLTDGLADLLSAVGSIDKKMDEQFSAVMGRLTSQHQELVSNLEQISLTSLRIESKVDRVLRILEDGRFLVEGTPPVAVDIQPEPGEAPFQGMQYFDEKDAPRFFGREVLVAKLAGRLQDARFLTVVGASGSGKSSLVRAGLLPALRSGKTLAGGLLPPVGCQDWLIHLITPGEHPLEALAVNLTGESGSLQAATHLRDDLMKEPRSLALAASRLVQGRSSKQKVLLVVDQFEEIFTLCRDEQERRAFLENLIYAVSPETSSVLKVVITLRADFYDECGRYPALRALLQDQQEYIGPMNAMELRSAIESPARLGGWEFEPGLVDLILRDVGDEPGALPLLSHALLETWNHRRGRMMTLESYAEAGGVRGAIAHTAETVFHQRLTTDQQTIARGIFLRMTELGEGTQDTRRRVALNELVTDTEKQAEIETVLAALVDARLVTTAENIAEVAHEALIREWPLLRTWLSEDREKLRQAVAVRSAAREWQQAGKDAALLIHRGARLEDALVLLNNASYPFNPQETEYLRACQDLVNSERRARESRRTRLLISIAVVAVVMLVLGIWGLSRAKEANDQLKIARTRQLAAEALSALDDFPVRSTLLAIEAVRYTTPPQQQAEENLRKALAGVSGIGLQGQGGSIHSLQISPNGSWLAIGAYDGKIQLWDLQKLAIEPVVLPGHNGLVIDLSYSPDSNWLASTGMDGIVRLWNMKDLEAEPVVFYGQKDFMKYVSFSPDGRWLAIGSDVARLYDLKNLKADPIVLYGHQSEISTLAFSKDGHFLATGSLDGTVRLWNMQNLSDGSVILNGHATFYTIMDFSPDGKWLTATGGVDKTILVWNLKDISSDPYVLSDYKGKINALAFSPDGRWLATGGDDKTALVWDMNNVEARPEILSGHSGTISTLAFSPDGLWLATGGRDDHTIRLWDTRNWKAQAVELKGIEDLLLVLTFSHDGRWLAAGGRSGDARLWDLSNNSTEPAVLRGHESEITSLAVSPDSHWVVSGSFDDLLPIWNLENPTAAPVTIKADISSIMAQAFSPDSRLLAFSNYHHEVLVWNLNKMTSSPIVLKGHTDSIWSMAFSPDGHWLATGSGDKTVRVWNMQDPSAAPAVFRGYEDTVNKLAFSPDGKWLATSSVQSSIALWNIKDRSSTPVVLSASEDKVLTLEFSPDGRWLAAVGYSKNAFLWDMQDLNAKPSVLSGHKSLIESIAFCPDSRWLATGSSDETARLWDLKDLAAEPVVFRGHEGWVRELAFSPDGHWLATGSEDGNARLWNMEDLSASPTIFSGHQAEIDHLMFSPDGRYLVTGSKDTTVRLWDMDLNRLVEKACIRAGRNFSQEEWRRYFPDEEYRLTCPQFPVGK